MSIEENAAKAGAPKGRFEMDMGVKKMCIGIPRESCERKCMLLLRNSAIRYWSENTIMITGVVPLLHLLMLSLRCLLDIRANHVPSKPICRIFLEGDHNWNFCIQTL